MDIVGLNEGLTTIPGPAEGHIYNQVQLNACTNIIRGGRNRTLLGIELPVPGEITIMVNARSPIGAYLIECIDCMCICIVELIII